jgi:hypothetical protein
MVLVVDPWHWLRPDGALPDDNPRLRTKVLRVARFIEYGGALEPRQFRETLIECKRRIAGKPCPGLIWVRKSEEDAIVAFCMICRQDEMFIYNWHDTEWADGMMEPASPDDLSLSH